MCRLLPVPEAVRRCCVADRTRNGCHLKKGDESRAGRAWRPTNPEQLVQRAGVAREAGNGVDTPDDCHRLGRRRPSIVDRNFGERYRAFALAKWPMHPAKGGDKKRINTKSRRVRSLCGGSVIALAAGVGLATGGFGLGSAVAADGPAMTGTAPASSPAVSSRGRQYPDERKARGHVHRGGGCQRCPPCRHPDPHLMR